MPEVRINAGATQVFPQGQLGDALDLDNRYNVTGTVQYQISVQPRVTVPIEPNKDYVIKNIRGEQVQVWNNLPNSLYCVW